MTPDTLRAARIALGLTQTEVADELGVDLRTFQRWEAGDAPLPRWLERKTATMIHRLHDAMLPQGASHEAIREARETGRAQ